MSQVLLLLCIFLSSFISLYAQTPSINPVFIESSKKANFNANDLQALGRVFYDKSWNAGNLHLKNGDTLYAYYIRYDLIKNQLEIIINQKLKAVREFQLNGFEWFSPERLKHEIFIDCSVYEEKTKNPYFVQLLVDGDYQLIKAKEILAKHKSSAPSLIADYSSPNEPKVEILEKYYYIYNNKLTELKRSDRKNEKMIDSDELTAFIDNNKLSFDKEAELIKIFTYLNEEVSQ